MEKYIAQMGIEPGRIQLVWASAAEGSQLVETFKKVVEEVRAMGPLNWGNPSERGRLEDLEMAYGESA